MRYISIDVETTGLDPASNQLLEVGMVIEDTEVACPVSSLPYRRILVPHREYIINIYCMKMHAELFETLDQVDWKRLQDVGSYRHAPKTYFTTLEDLGALMQLWIAKHLGDKNMYVAAGKNFYGFDHKFLAPWLNVLRFHHRALDPCTLYMQPNDVVPPDLATCCKRAGVEVSNYHTAVGDARMVIELLRRR